MARMTKLQTEHALNRVSQITRTLLAKVKQPDAVWTYSGSEAIEAFGEDSSLFTKNDFVVAATKAAATTTWCSDLDTSFTKQLSKILNKREEAKGRQAYEAQKKIYNKHSAKVFAQRERVRDEIILGDVEHALELVQAFAQFKV